MRIAPPAAVMMMIAAALIACADDVPVSPASPAAFQTGASLLACGFENAPPCAAIPGPRCDRSLRVDGRDTPRPSDDRCVNDTRRLVGSDFEGSWAHWALANQRTLAIDEPFNWVTHLVTHNANNNWADGETSDPNQVWSMSDQLSLGARGLWIDLHWVAGAVRLCHAQAVGEDDVELHVGCTPLDRPFAYAVREIADWLSSHPGEIIFIDFDHHVEGHLDEVIEPLQAYFGAKLYRGDARAETDRWPTRRELLAMGKQVMIGVLGDPDFHGYAHQNHQPATLGIRNVKDLLVDRNGRGIVTGCRTGADFDGDRDLVRYGDHHKFRLIGEDRTMLAAGRYGLTTGPSVADQAACNIRFLSLDMIGGALFTPRAAWLHGPLPLEERQPYAVWSWRDGDRGQDGDVVMLDGPTGRWHSANPNLHRRFACGRERSETTRNPAAWRDRLGTEWRITTRSGPWREGGRACLEEFGADGFVFSVPVNGWMNGQLRIANTADHDLWLNYDSFEGGWRINQRPQASAGADQRVECNGHHGTTVQLNAGSSVDPDGHAMAFEWQGPFGTATGATPTVVLPLGTHVVTLIVDDGFGGVSTDEVTIEVVDTTAPEIHSAAATPNELWPVNHKMRPVAVEVDVSDLCDANPTCRIVTVTSNEPANARGDGNTDPDWRITGALTAELRAERVGRASGRVYTLTIECADASGNVATTTLEVLVPHDRR